MILYLLRHAQAEVGSFRDDTPALTAAGRAQAEHVAVLLGNAGLRRFLSSPARRCLETLTPLAEARPGATLETEPRLLEGAPLSGLLEVVENLDDEPSVLCSHGDLIPELLGHFQRKGLETLEAPRCEKASVWIVEHDSRGWNARYLAPPDSKVSPPFSP